MQWSDISFTPSSRTLRQFAGLWLFFLGGLAWLTWAKHGRPGPPLTLALAAVTVGFLGLFKPQAVRAIYVAAMIVTFPVGWLLSRLILVVLFYGMFAPTALLFRALGRDVLHRRRHEQPTYWSPKPMPADAASYFRQF